MLRRSILLLAVTAFLLLAISPPSLASTKIDDDDEDLSFLQEGDPSNPTGDHQDSYESDGEELDDLEDSYEDLNNGMPAVDEKDVVILKESNFSDYVESHRFVMVEFYAPWCGHCQSLAPEYAAAATHLKEQGVDVTLVKVDGTEEADLAQEYNVDGFPTIYFFSDGAHKPYTGPRSKDSIVNWINKKLGPGVDTLTTLDEAEKVLTSDSKLVLGFLSSVKGEESDELVAASKLDDDCNFYQTENADVAKLFHLDAGVKRPALVLVKKEDEKLVYFDGNFSKSEIAKFVLANKNPLVTIFTKEAASAIFDSDVKKQVILFTNLNESANFLPVFKQVAKNFMGKLLFIYVEMDNEDYGKPVAEFFGITGDDPKVIGYTGNEEAKKFIYDKEITADNLKTFAVDFVDDKLQPFYKSDPVPETNDGDVKVVVGKNFDEIVLDESKDVLLEIYAPWCGHCQSLEPAYNKLAKHLRGIDSLVIAKMDGTTNEHPRAKQDGFPTILLFPAGNKNFDPITMSSDRTVVAMYKFLKKHVTMPFKIQKPASKSKGSADRKDDDNAKDEL